MSKSESVVKPLQTVVPHVMAPNLGMSLHSYNTDVEPIDTFLDSLDAYFGINGIEDKQKVSFLTILLSPDYFNVLKNKLAPNKVANNLHQECAQMIKSHYSPSDRIITDGRLHKAYIKI